MTRCWLVAVLLGLPLGVLALVVRLQPVKRYPLDGLFAPHCPTPSIAGVVIGVTGADQAPDNLRHSAWGLPDSVRMTRLPCRRSIFEPHALPAHKLSAGDVS